MSISGKDLSTLSATTVSSCWGQRQQVTIAHALLKDAGALVLDGRQVTPATNIKQQVYREIEGIKEEYTIFMIAHRLSTVTNADRIYTVSDHRVVQQGTHEELIKRDGTYALLYS